MSVPSYVDPWPFAMSMLPDLWAFAFRLCGDAGSAEALVENAYRSANFQESASEDRASVTIQLYARIYIGWTSREGDESKPFTHVAAFLTGGSDPSLLDVSSPVHSTSFFNAFNSLPDVERAVVLLVKVAEMSVTSAAKVMDTTPQNVMARLRAAEAMMRSLIAASGHKDPRQQDRPRNNRVRPRPRNHLGLAPGPLQTIPRDGQPS
jgi:DNA-directed RNA polymerase specialized sigma24 family protein